MYVHNSECIKEVRLSIMSLEAFHSLSTTLILHGQIIIIFSVKFFCNDRPIYSTYMYMYLYMIVNVVNVLYNNMYMYM